MVALPLYKKRYVDISHFYRTTYSRLSPKARDKLKVLIDEEPEIDIYYEVYEQLFDLMSHEPDLVRKSALQVSLAVLQEHLKSADFSV